MARLGFSVIALIPFLIGMISSAPVSESTPTQLTILASNTTDPSFPLCNNNSNDNLKSILGDLGLVSFATIKTKLITRTEPTTSKGAFSCEKDGCKYSVNEAIDTTRWPESVNQVVLLDPNQSCQTYGRCAYTKYVIPVLRKTGCSNGNEYWAEERLAINTGVQCIFDDEAKQPCHSI
eukprot:m.3866 g.3866  ORF g.3866 m.3866 type:complete len:178 (+) comp9893_c0_seq1:57-590(+)